MSEKILKRIIQVSVALLALWVIANIDIDTLIGIVCGPILIYVFYCILSGKFKIVAGSGGSARDKNKPKTGVSHPVSWRNDKTYVPGAGYRDKYGNYYDYNGIPKVNPVDVKDD